MEKRIKRRQPEQAEENGNGGPLQAVADSFLLAGIIMPG